MVHRPSQIFTKACELLSHLPPRFAPRTNTSSLTMDRYSQYQDGWENQGQYPTQEEIVDPYLNDETVGVPPEDQLGQHENNFYPSQEEQELEQRGHYSDDTMDQNPGSYGAFNLKVTQSGGPSSFDPSGLVSQIPEMDKEGVNTGGEGPALQPPTVLEFAGLGRNGSVYYKAGPPRRSGALRRPSSRYRAQQILEEEEGNPSYPADQVEPGAYGHGDHPLPSQGGLDQQTASEESLYGENGQPREEPSSMAHSLADQAAQSGYYPSVPDTLQPGIAHNPQAAQAVPGSKPMGRPIPSSISPESRRGFHPQEHTSPAPRSHASPPLQERQAIVPQVAPQRPPQPGLQPPQRQGQTVSRLGNPSMSPQRTPPQMQQRAPVAPDPSRYAQGVHPPAPVTSPSQRPTNLPGSQARQSAVPRPETSQSTPSGQQGTRPPQMAGPQQAQDPQQRAAQQQRQNRPPAMVPSQNDQHPSRKPVLPARRPLQSSPARTQEAATQRPLRGQESFEPRGMQQQQQQQQQRQPPSSRQQQGALSSAPYNTSPRPGGFQQPQQPIPSNSSTAPMGRQQGSMQQAHSPPLNEMAASAPLYDPNATARPQRDQQNNDPPQAYGAVEPILAPQQQQPPAEPYGRQQDLTRSPPPQPATMSPSQRPLALDQTSASIPNESVTDAQIPPSPSSTQPPAQVRAPLRTQPPRTTPPAPLTGESLLSTFMQGRPVPRLDVRDPKHGSALMQGAL